MNNEVHDKHISFQLLLGSLMFLLFAPGLFPGEIGALLSRALFTLTLIACLYLVSDKKKDLFIGIALAVPVLFTNWILIAFINQPVQAIIYGVCQLVFIAYIVARIFQFLIAARRVDAQMIYAALCLYLLFGLLWTLAYFVIALLDPGAINLVVDITNSDHHGTTQLLHELIYFSFVTQTTLGYGDLLPVSGIARAFVITQALVGQIYVAVVIARLVGLQIAYAVQDQE